MEYIIGKRGELVVALSFYSAPVPIIEKGHPKVPPLDLTIIKQWMDPFPK